MSAAGRCASLQEVNARIARQPSWGHQRGEPTTNLTTTNIIIQRTAKQSLRGWGMAQIGVRVLQCRGVVRHRGANVTCDLTRAARRWLKKKYQRATNHCFRRSLSSTPHRVYSTPLVPQSRCGDKLHNILLVCPPNGTAVPKGLNRDFLWSIFSSSTKKKVGQFFLSWRPYTRKPHFSLYAEFFSLTGHIMIYLSTPAVCRLDLDLPL